MRSMRLTLSQNSFPAGVAARASLDRAIIQLAVIDTEVELDEFLAARSASEGAARNSSSSTSVSITANWIIARSRLARAATPAGKLFCDSVKRIERISLPPDYLPERISPFPGAADDGAIRTPLVWRRPYSLDELHAVF